MGYSIVNVEEIEAGRARRRDQFVRRELGVEAFGINWFEIPPGTNPYEHDEEETAQEEVIVIIRGSGGLLGGWQGSLHTARARACASIPTRRAFRSQDRRG